MALNSGDRVSEILDDAEEIPTVTTEPANDVDKSDTESVVRTPDSSQLAKGAVCEMKDLYATKNSVCSCCETWSEDPPVIEDKTSKDTAIDQAATFALIRRRVLHGGTGSFKTKLFNVMSPHLRPVLAKVFEGYPVSYGTDLDIELRPRFLPFVHRWSRLLQALQSEEDSTTRDHISLLCDALKGEVQSDLERLDRAQELGAVHFEDIALLFAPGETLVNRSDRNAQCAGILKSLEMKGGWGPPYLRLTVDTVDWNGKEFGYKERTWIISYFDGSIKIPDLSVTLLRCLPDEDAVRNQLITRARKFEELTGLHFRHYDGPVSGGGPSAINERVIIDTAGYYELESEDRPRLRSFDGTVAENDNGRDDDDDDCSDSDSQHERSSRISHPTQTSEQQRPKLTDDQGLLLHPWIRGFALNSRTWLWLLVDKIGMIKYTEDLVHKLVLDADDKELIVSCVKKTCSSGNSFDDFVPGKGKGLIMLFCGPPGVGKTLAAEAVPEELHRPLYRLNMLDINLSVSSVESSLEQALARCARWNAVLLIDEADVFIEARSSESLKRNELVSVFLRQLEYYQGVMILTSNRISNIDPAFESRIDITLAFDDLTESARLQIWRNFLDTLGTSIEISEEELQALAKSPLNGRQIKSAIKTACVVFGGESTPVKARHLQVIIKNRRKATQLLSHS